MKRIRNVTAVFVLSLTLMAAACPKTVDVMKKLSDTIALFEPFVQALGIVPEQLKPIIADGKDISKIASDLTAEFSVATTRAEKFAAANKAQLAMVVVVNRNHFSVDARVMGIVNLISAAFSSVANFYSDVPQGGAGPKPSEQEFAKTLDSKVEEIKRALGK